MKISPLWLSCSILFITHLGFAKQPDILNNPKQGVVCDQYLCADQSGISLALTRDFLGESQLKKLLSQGKINTSKFTFANGIFCDTQTKLCHQDRYFNQYKQRSAVDLTTTNMLFGHH